jgi:hypothetical protein
VGDAFALALSDLCLVNNITEFNLRVLSYKMYFDGLLVRFEMYYVESSEGSILIVCTHNSGKKFSSSFF